MSTESAFVPSASQVWLVGAGVASLAAAVFLIRDAAVPAHNIHILEESDRAGGALDGDKSPVQAGYVTRGGRMLTDEAYQTLWNLLQTIPSLEDPKVSVRDEIRHFNQMVRSQAHGRLIDRNRKIVDASAYGLDNRDRLEMIRLMATPERALGARRIDEMFSGHFFDSRFWQMWRTTFAFQPWHSAAEMKRYLRRFLQELPRLDTLSGVRGAKYNQYDSIVRPIQRWLTDKGVNWRFGERVVDVEFDQSDMNDRRVTRLVVVTKGLERTIDIGDNDVAMFTLGSITADARYGGNDSAPELIRDRRDGAWALYDRIAAKARDFGRPSIFYGVDQNKWESFTLTMHGDALLNRLIVFSGNAPGAGALMTFYQSKWLLSLTIPHQPHFPDMPKNTYTAWGYGLNVDAEGDYVKKPMAQCTGCEILTELIGHLGFDDIKASALASTDVTSVMMPYASAMFAPRVSEDRPLVIPKGAGNFAFLGQFVEMPEDTVFTVEYSVHGAMRAVYELYGVDKPIPAIYHGLMDPEVGLQALESTFR